MGRRPESWAVWMDEQLVAELRRSICDGLIYVCALGRSQYKRVGDNQGGFLCSYFFCFRA